MLFSSFGPFQVCKSTQHALSFLRSSKQHPLGLELGEETAVRCLVLDLGRSAYQPYVTADKSLNLSVPQCPRLESGDNNHFQDVSVTYCCVPNI